jgi:hypothetical protein
MANGPQDAIENATRLSEINFPEFTAKLITDTFNAITASYIDQMAQYVNLLQLVGQSLQDYINATRDDINADEINTFLVTVAGLNDDALSFLLGDPATSPQLSQAEVTAINDAVALPAAAGPSAPPAAAGTLNNNKRQTIAQVVARRIAAKRTLTWARGSAASDQSGDTHRSPAIAQRLCQSTVMLKLPE